MPASLGIIGYPIAHSISPIFQQAALDHCGIDATYQAFEVAPEQVGRFVGDLRRDGAWGINVTVPHKEAVIPYIDEVDDWATAAGAVNTIVNREGRLTGHNTDGLGFLRALRDEGGFVPEGSRVLVLGAGGAARGVGLALSREKGATITIANRTLERGQRLAELAQSADTEGLAIPLDVKDLTEAAGAADLIVNCTTIGMSHGPDEAGSPLPAASIPSNVLVNDLVYNPLVTPILKAAAEAGAACLGGIHMLIYQGAASFEMWTGQDAPVAVMLEAATKAMAAR